ncbi:MAG: flagellar basal body P-ring protein FlgI [Proteobacteria bacterium]|nr:flagellar basal body P-ring protein FlgI [Pseudomonadota bacterium]
MAILGLSTDRVYLSKIEVNLKNRYYIYFVAILSSLLISLLFTPDIVEAARIKEISNFEGVRSNHLVGYGLVVGLEGKGDKSGTEFTTQSLVNMLNRFGVKVDPNDVTVKNVASVIVTADLSPFNRLGSRLDVVVSSIGDAKTLQGGTLIFTPLNGADGEVYAVAQGSVSVGGFIGGGDDTSVQKNFQTVGRVSGGALVEKEVPYKIEGEIDIILKVPDFTTSAKIADIINATKGPVMAKSVDAAKVRLTVSPYSKLSPVSILSDIEQLEIPIDIISRVVVNERTGTVVIGKNVRISTVAVAHGNLTVEIETRHRISQPASFGSGETVVKPEKTVRVTEGTARLITLEEGVELSELVAALNALGVTPRDLIAILQSIKAAGALQAELVII